jgi:hypothetical protein
MLMYIAAPKKMDAVTKANRPSMYSLRESAPCPLTAIVNYNNLQRRPALRCGMHDPG